MTITEEQRLRYSDFAEPFRPIAGDFGLWIVNMYLETGKVAQVYETDHNGDDGEPRNGWVEIFPTWIHAAVYASELAEACLVVEEIRSRIVKRNP